MTQVEFENWLADEVSNGRMKRDQMEDLLEQKRHFDANRVSIEQQHKFLVVGYVDGKKQVGKTVHEVLDKAKAQLPGRMVYFEPIGFDLF